ncbi:hypothetical protein MWU57_04285 [Isoptericola sp. S6320L]|uniref:ATP-binding protein n=1 Tax=Isoptericola sp. S6320L TaxID=2926411 RepID=UPI001FF32B48|nr:ATP-binding protein [Isoptericola sp. S6320L]MCK0116243.1 hypothetical protein [Isoptericola sp. S6320L]
MSTTTPARPPATGRVLPWLCVAGMVLCVAALPLVGASAPPWGVGVLGVAAVVLPVTAAVLLSRASRRDAAAFRALSVERDGLAAGLHETTQALRETTAALTAEQEARADQRAAVETAVVALSRKVQASAHRIQEEAARMVQRHAADPDVLQTSMRIDHAAAQHARQAQSLVALCGRRPGQTWEDALPLPDVVKAAAGRITAFQRVEVSGDPGLAVVGRAAEPLVHVVAELLANATQCSPPNTQVLVVIRQVQRGAVIEIDDCGVGMDPRELGRVRAIAAGERSVGIAELGEVPQTGLAVVGTYARFLDLRVDLTESVYGGMRAVVMVPGDLTEVAATAPTVLAPSVDDAWAATPAREPAATGAVPPVAADRPPAGPPVLPQRRSRRGAADGPLTVGRGLPQTNRPERPTPDQTAEEAGAWIGAFFAATADAPSQDDPDTHEPSVATDGTSEDR